MKILFVASSGGHWEELLCLKNLFDVNDSVFVTEIGGQADDFHGKKLYQLPQINRREKGFIKEFFSLCFQVKRILRTEKPNVVITTGALVSFPFCLLGKIKKAKIIYIESFARVENKSLTGKLVYPFADLFLVQWESMLKLSPKDVYVGGIF